MTNRIPSSLTRSQGAGAPDRQPRREPTAAQIAMMTADQIKAYHERKGTWGMSQADREEVFPHSIPSGPWRARSPEYKGQL